MRNKHVGSSFDDFLKEQGSFNEAQAHALKMVVLWQIEQAMAKQGISKAQMAKRMHTSRTQVKRLLDPENNKVQLDTLQRAATAVGRSLRLELT